MITLTGINKTAVFMIVLKKKRVQINEDSLFHKR